MRHLITSIGKAALAVAVILPGADAVLGAASEFGDLNQTEGFAAGVRTVAGGLEKGVEFTGDIAATVGNKIGVDYIAGVGNDGLDVDSFNEEFGIIPKVVGNAWENGPEAIGNALKGENRATLLTGAAVGAGATALLPGASEDIRGATQTTVRTMGSVGRSAMQTAGAVGQHTQRLIDERASAQRAPHVRT